MQNYNCILGLQSWRYWNTLQLNTKQSITLIEQSHFRGTEFVWTDTEIRIKVFMTQEFWPSQSNASIFVACFKLHYVLESCKWFNSLISELTPEKIRETCFISSISTNCSVSQVTQIPHCWVLWNCNKRSPSYWHDAGHSGCHLFIITCHTFKLW